MPNLPNSRLLPTTFLASLTLTSSACFVAAAGAGAGGAVYVSERDIDAQLASSVDDTYRAARRVFDEMGISEGKYGTEHEGDREERTLTGRTDDREVSVRIISRGAGSRISVTARRDEVVWDKKLARRIVDRIVTAADATRSGR